MTAYDDYGIPVGAYSEPEGLVHQAWRVVRAFYLYRIRPIVNGRYNAWKRGEWRFRQVFTLVNALVLVWWVVLYWGEKGTFDGVVKSCRWERWEKWEEGANPHRLIFVADPQLIDPHSYPGRPWPLNPLAYKYTDLYLRRTYTRLQRVLYPDTVFFLGDLFDGGREWSTRTTTSPEKQFRKYGDDFWLNEYRRFGDIFFEHWSDGGRQARPGQAGRKVISSLPGNHDLGFAEGVQVGVRDRFNAYFGDGNRIDVIANHTFVSIDSVSLSALASDSPDQVKDLWQSTTDFLSNAATQKRRLIQRELRKQQGLPPYPGFPHHAIEGSDLPSASLPHSNDDITEFPTILLTHVPLYRAPGTPCGPQREHWPPTPPPAGQPPLTHDDRNAISVSFGYQYQNVLNKKITIDIANKVGDISYAFSGDDHDYCEVLHRGYASAGSGIREITVKSISWAMGVRRPGVVLVSLWNPVDVHGKSLGGEKTVQTKLCLLPDQIGTFLRYGILFGGTLILLVLRAALLALGLISTAPTATESPLLPTAEHEKQHGDDLASGWNGNSNGNAELPHSSNSSTDSDHTGHLQARTRTIPSSTTTSNYVLPSQQKYTYPLVQSAGYHIDEAEDLMKRQVKVYGRRHQRVHMKPRKRRKGWGLFWYEAKWGVLVVGGCAGVVYVWCVWGDGR